jgi:hypothetical protein
MKLFELRNLPLTEEVVADRIKNADWMYEFCDDTRRQERGQLEMDRLESMVFEYWKQNPEKAVELWNTLSPVGARDKKMVPSFIVRLTM